jgi:hypothetical protein
VEEYTQIKNAKSDNSAAIFVSLYLILLVFFILLNSQARQDNGRAFAVVESVQNAFRFNVIDPQTLMVSVGKPSDRPEMLQQIEQSLSMLVQMGEVDLKMRGNTLMMRMPRYVLLLDGDTPQVDPATEDFFNNLAETLNQWRESGPTEVDILIGYYENSLRKRGIENLVEVAQADALVRELTTRDIPPGTVTAGVTPYDPGYIRFAFTVRAPDPKNKIRAEEVQP